MNGSKRERDGRSDPRAGRAGGFMRETKVDGAQQAAATEGGRGPLRVGVERGQVQAHGDKASTVPSPSRRAPEAGRLAGRSPERASTQTTKAAIRSNAASTTNSGL